MVSVKRGASLEPAGGAPGTKALDCPWNQGPGFNAEGALLKDEPFLEAKRKPGQGCESGVIKKDKKITSCNICLIH